MVLMSLLSDEFLDPENLLNQGRLAAEIALIALPMTLIIVTGGIDLSVGSIVGLTAIILGVAWQDWGLPLGIAIAVAVLVGTACGLFNGLFITRVGLPPLITTLATLALFRGLAEGIAQARSVRGYPEWFYALGQKNFLGDATSIPNQLFLVVISVAIIGAALAWTPFGRSLYAIGNNETGARFSGLPVQRNKLIIYTLSGFMSGLAGWVFVSRVSTTRSDMGTGFELTAITAVVVGGTSIFGGSGTIIGTVLGLALIQLLKNGLALGRSQGRFDHHRGRRRPHPRRADQRAHPQPAGAAEQAAPRSRDTSPREEVTGARFSSVSGPTRQDTVRSRREEETQDMRKPIVLLTVLTLAPAFAATASVHAQEDRWDGGDDLPTNPLPCGDEEPAPAEGEAPEYDGGQPTDAPDMAGQPITLVDIPKLIGIGYFNATAQGMQEAAEELGNVEVINDGPTVANIDEQITFIDNYITQGVDGVLFAANDPVAIGPVLTKALEEGIHVVGYDANSVPEAREWFVNQAEFNGIAKAMIDSFVAEQGEDASFGIVTSTFTTPNQARWIAEMEATTPRRATRT